MGKSEAALKSYLKSFELEPDGKYATKALQSSYQTALNTLNASADVELIEKSCRYHIPKLKVAIWSFVEGGLPHILFVLEYNPLSR